MGHRLGRFIWPLVISPGKGYQMVLGDEELAYGSCLCCLSSTLPRTR